MKLTPISRWLLRAPLLPVASLARSPETIFRQPLARAALAIAQPDLPAAGAERARRHYARRAAFRATPRGLWAGVAVGELGAKTRIATDAMRAHLTVSWARLAALGRALLEEPRFREQARVRVAPSLLRGAREVKWLGRGSPAVTRTAHVDELLERLLDAAGAWRPWPEVRAALAEPGDLDEYLLLLVDDGLLSHDLEPPLVGPAPLAWMLDRLGGRLPGLERAAGGLADLRDPEAAAALARRELEALPGAGGESLHSVLIHEPRDACLSRAAVERATGVADLLFRLQAALTPPAGERELDRSLLDTVESVGEQLGDGALDLGALERGDYGVPLSSDTEAEISPATPPALVAFFVERLLEAAARGDDELALRASDLDAVTPPCRLPASFELMLTPMREPRGRPPGSGWLLGLHAPAGATWGRFAEALGAEMALALEELAGAEARARPGEEALDVAYTPMSELGDLTAHPPLRRRALALSSWPAGGALTPAELELCASASDPLALRAGGVGGQPVAPSPLFRVRSQTAPPGAFQLLVGFSLFRQHAPWALTLGPLAALPRLPRVSVEGFVVMPASFSLPPASTPAGLGRWRRALGVPRQVQIGHEDELLLIDLGAPEAAGELARLREDGCSRAWEVWPPEGALVDEGGRRLEAVVAVVREADDETRAAIARVAAAAAVPPPAASPPAEGWRTFKLFGVAERHPRVLGEGVAPAVTAAQLAGEINAWFFLPYVEGPGRREHLRLRVHAADAHALDAFQARLSVALAPSRARGDLVTVETAEYQRELARYGEDAIAAVERVFESDSRLVCELAAIDQGDLLEKLVASFDTLAAGAGLTLVERRALAMRRREAYGLFRDQKALSEAFRALKPRLQAALTTPAGCLVAHRDRVAEALAELAPARREALLPALLHLAAVRLAGPSREIEMAAVYFWERTLDGLAKRQSAVSRTSGSRG